MRIAKTSFRFAQAFPVTPEVNKAAAAAEPWELHGCILRTTLLRLLAHRLGLTPGAPLPLNGSGLNALGGGELAGGSGLNSGSDGGGLGGLGSGGVGGGGGGLGGGGSGLGGGRGRRLLPPEPPPARAHVPASQRERLALLEQLEQIPLKVSTGVRFVPLWLAASCFQNRRYTDRKGSATSNEESEATEAHRAAGAAAEVQPRTECPLALDRMSPSTTVS